MNARPNILFITSDQQRADCVGYENPQVRTPHIDALAQTGTRFKNCITPNVVCQPARASILTGQLPLTHGVWDNGVDLDPAIGNRGMAGQLAQAGYFTSFVGKAHFSTKNTFKPTGTPECRSSAPNFDDDWYGPYMGFEHVELASLGKFHRNRLPKMPRLSIDLNIGSYLILRLWICGREVCEKSQALHRHGIRLCQRLGTVAPGWLIALWL